MPPQLQASVWPGWVVVLLAVGGWGCMQMGDAFLPPLQLGLEGCGPGQARRRLVYCGDLMAQ